MPMPTEDTILFLAGTTAQVTALKEIANKMGYKYLIVWKLMFFKLLYNFNFIYIYLF